MDRLGGITPDAQPAPARARGRRDRRRRPRAGAAGGLVRLTPAGADSGPSSTRSAAGAAACLAPARGRRAAARRAPAPLRYPGHQPRRRRPRTSQLALPARRRGLPGRKRRPPVVTHRRAPARTADVTVIATAKTLTALIFAGSDAGTDITGETGPIQRFRQLIGTMASVVQPVLNRPGVHRLGCGRDRAWRFGRFPARRFVPRFWDRDTSGWPGQLDDGDLPVAAAAGRYGDRRSMIQPSPSRR